MSVEPFCKYYGTCGGCQLQHVEEGEYRQMKTALVRDALQVKSMEWPDIDLIDAHGEGRRRMSLHVRQKDRKVMAGFMARRSHDLIDIDRCPIVVPALARATDIARTLGEKLGDCDVSLTAADNGLDVSVKAERRVAAQQHARLASLATELGLLRLTINGETLATVASPFVTLDGTRVELPPGAFLQATSAGEAALAQLVLMDAGKSKSIADLFCGLGPFVLRLAKHAKIMAVDDDKPAITALQQALRYAQGLKPVTAIKRNLMREPLTEMELKPFDAVVFDPPRAGAEAQARRLAKSSVQRVISVSCNPQTFARDARILMDGGYKLAALTAVDQFKWSTHVECVGVFRR
jgi:23S rRNA (uracil1939-C5)-methyltransferase